MTLRDFCKIGTLAHNRDFSPREYREYVWESSSGAWRTSSADIRSLVRRGLLCRTTAGRYYPTGKGWRVLERACRMVVSK